MIGFWVGDKKTKPGVYEPNIKELPYTGDILKNYQQFQSVESKQNENLTINNRLSIVSNLYMRNNYHSIKYVKWNGIKWKVKSIDISSYPRVIMELGGLYDENTA